MTMFVVDDTCETKLEPVWSFCIEDSSIAYVVPDTERKLLTDMPLYAWLTEVITGRLCDE
jgi:hypothetical protein